MTKNSQETHSLFKLILLLFISLFISCAADDKGNDSDDSAYLKDYIYPENLWGLINIKNKVVYKPTFDEIRPFQDSYAAVNIKGKWGFIDSDLKLAIKPQYRAAWNFKNGFARIQYPDGSYNYINNSNETLSEHNFLYAHDFEKTFATAKIGLDSFIIINSAGNFSEVVKAEDLSPTEYGYFIAENFENEIIYDTQGQEINSLVYDKIMPLSENAIIAKDKNMHGAISLDREILIPFKYYRLSSYENGWIVGIGESGIDIYKDFKPVRTFTEYMEIRYAGFDRFIFMHNGKWGFMDTEFNIIAEPIYDQLDNFSQAVAAYQREVLWGYVNIMGIELIEPSYGLAFPYIENHARVVFYEGMGIIDKNQKIKIPPSGKTYRDLSASYIAFKGR